MDFLKTWFEVFLGTVPIVIGLILVTLLVIRLGGLIVTFATYLYNTNHWLPLIVIGIIAGLGFVTRIAMNVYDAEQSAQDGDYGM